jgi:hypothetical protein
VGQRREGREGKMGGRRGGKRGKGRKREKEGKEGEGEEREVRGGKGKRKGRREKGRRRREGWGRDTSTPHWSKLLMFQMTPCTKILCSYMAVRAPKVLGVKLENITELVGLFPGKTLCGKIFRSCSSGIPERESSASASSEVFPRMRASVCAKKLAKRIL